MTTKSKRMISDPSNPFVFEGYSIRSVTFKYKAWIVFLCIVIALMILALHNYAQKIDELEKENFYLKDAIILKNKLLK
jgi:hypothetical protein